MLFLPTLYYLYDSRRLRKAFFNQVQRLFLYQNGEQLALQTYDGMYHKINITGIESYEILDKKNHLIFKLVSNGRAYIINNEGCSLIDFELLDRVLKGIQIDA